MDVDRCSVVGPGGAEEALPVQAVVSAVGQLNRPNYPAIDGVRSLRRPDLPLRPLGPRGRPDGASASPSSAPAPARPSSSPTVAEAAGHLTIFQRTPAWFLPTPDYHDPVEPEVRWLLRNVPGYANWYRFWIFWRNVEGLLQAAAVDPYVGGDPNRSVSEINEFVRQMLAGYLDAEFADRPDLLDAGAARLPAVRQAVHPRQRDLGRAPSSATTSTS